MNSVRTRFTKTLLAIVTSTRGGIGVFIGLFLLTLGVAAVPLEGTPPSPHVTQYTSGSSAGVLVSTKLAQEKLVQNQAGELSMEVIIDTSEIAHPQDLEIKASDIVVVLDRSGSMSPRDRFPLAKQAINKLIESLTEQDRFALVSFSTHATIHSPLSYVSEAKRAELGELVRGLRASGSTNMEAGLSTARGLFQEPSTRVRKIILLSDGEANLGVTEPRLLAGMAKSIARKQVVLSAVGLGLGFNEVLLSSLADHGMGRYNYLESLVQLDRILLEELEQSRSVYATSSDSILHLASGVQLIDAGGYPIENIEKGRSNRVSIPTGQLLSSSKKTLILNFRVPNSKLGAAEIGNWNFTFNTNDQQKHLVSGEAPLQYAVLPASESKDAYASIDTDLYRKNWTTNNFGRLQQKLSDSIREGNRTKAKSLIAEYREEAQAATVIDEELNRAVMADVAVKAEKLDALVGAAFSGSEMEQRDKRQRSAKDIFSKGLKSQRPLN